MSNIKKIILATTLLCLPFFAMAGAIELNEDGETVGEMTEEEAAVE